MEGRYRGYNQPTTKHSSNIMKTLNIFTFVLFAFLIGCTSPVAPEVEDLDAAVGTELFGEDISGKILQLRPAGGDCPGNQVPNPKDDYKCDCPDPEDDPDNNGMCYRVDFAPPGPTSSGFHFQGKVLSRY